MSAHLIFGLLGVVGLTCVVFALGRASARPPVEELADPAKPARPELARAGCFELVESYRPAPPLRADRSLARGPSGFDTGPLWIVSETLAAGDQFARENPWLWEDAARRIGPVQ